MDGEVPKTVMSGETSGISQFCKLDWYNWVLYQDETAPLPDDVLKLVCYLGPIVDVGPAITARILTEKGQLLHRSTYRLLP